MSGGIPSTRTASVTTADQGTPRPTSRCPANKVMVGMQWRRGANSETDPFLKGIDYIECASLDEIMLRTLPAGAPRTLSTPVPVTRVNVNQGVAGGTVVHRRCGAGTLLDSMILPRIEMSPHRVGALSSTSDGATIEIPVGLCRAVLPVCDPARHTTPAAWNQCMGAEPATAGAWAAVAATPSGAALHPSSGLIRTISRGISGAAGTVGRGVGNLGRDIGRGITTTFADTIPNFVVSSANTVAGGVTTGFDTVVGGIDQGLDMAAQTLGLAAPPLPPDINSETTRVGCGPENGPQRLAGTHNGIRGIQLATSGDGITNVTVECGTVSRTPPLAAPPAAIAAPPPARAPAPVAGTGLTVPGGGAVSLGAQGGAAPGATPGGGGVLTKSVGGIPMWAIIAAGVLLLIIIIVILAVTLGGDAAAPQPAVAVAAPVVAAPQPAVAAPVVAAPA